MTKATAHLRWDIFCQVIDNFGDIGVCWRLAADLGSRGHRVRLWVDDASALAWMAPQGAPGVQVLPWPTQAPADGPGDVVVEAFGCEIAPQFIAAIAHHTNATGPKPLWINLEYLSAEAYVERCHRLPSPLMSGPGAGLTRWFYYPGFTERTGGLLREPDLLARQAAFDAPPGAPATASGQTKSPSRCSATSHPPCPNCWRNGNRAATCGCWSRPDVPRRPCANGSSSLSVKTASKAHTASASSYQFHICYPALSRPLTKCSGPAT